MHLTNEGSQEMPMPHNCACPPAHAIFVLAPLLVLLAEGLAAKAISKQRSGWQHHQLPCPGIGDLDLVEVLHIPQQQLNVMLAFEKGELAVIVFGGHLWDHSVQLDPVLAAPERPNGFQAMKPYRCTTATASDLEVSRLVHRRFARDALNKLLHVLQPFELAADWHFPMQVLDELVQSGILD